MREAGEEPTRQGGGRSSIGRKKADCPICRRGRPRDVVAERHVVEPFELPAPSGFAFWRDVLLVAKALADLFSPVKMNYEIHGNTIPHLHVHLYPRFHADPFVGRPIDPREASFARSKAERTRIGRAIRRADARSRSTRTAHR